MDPVCEYTSPETDSYLGFAHVDTPNIGPMIVYFVSIGLHMMATMLFNERISIGVLRHCSLSNIKESAKNAWTNIGVTTSLVMTTIIGALIEGHEITPQGYCLGSYQLFQIRQVYVALCLVCLFANINCILYCVLTLSYWDSLTDADAVKFLRQNPQVLGETIIYMMESYVFFVLALAAWIYGTYGRPMAFGIFIALFLSAFSNIARIWWNLSAFDPTKAGATRRKVGMCARTGKQWQHLLDQVSERQPMAAQSPRSAGTGVCPKDSDEESCVCEDATNQLGDESNAPEEVHSGDADKSCGQYIAC